MLACQRSTRRYAETRRPRRPMGACRLPSSRMRVRQEREWSSSRAGRAMDWPSPARARSSRCISRRSPTRVARSRDKERAAGLRLRFLGANEGVRLAAARPLPGKVNYLLGNDPSKWVTGIHTFGAVRYERLYPGVDARFYGRQGRLEYDLIVAPGADPSRIGLALSGARTLRLDARGNLLVRLPDGTLVQRRAHIYQLIDGRRQPVAGRYVLHGGDRFGFRLGAYDTRRPLVIDPVLAYSTYLGGSNIDNGESIAVDAAGAAYVAGLTSSAAFPTTPGALDTSYNGGVDAFVAKLAPSGASLVYATYLGGSRIDAGVGIAVDPTGAAYATGRTFSSDFPTTPGALDTSYNGGVDAFVAKLSPSGSSLVYSTYLGGSGREDGTGIAVDATGSAYVTGDTASAGLPDDAWGTRHLLQRRRGCVRHQGRCERREPRLLHLPRRKRSRRAARGSPSTPPEAPT